MINMPVKTKILPEAQQELWPLLKEVPDHFVLYGGTAVALRYGHRESVDFDFFSTKRTPFMSNAISALENLSFVKKFNQGAPRKSGDPRLGLFVEFALTMSNKEKVNVSFVESETSIPGALKAPDVTIGNKIYIASSDDLMATKIHTLGKRAALKDYIDVKEMIKRGVSISKGFAGAMCFRGKNLERDFSVFEDMCKTLRDPERLQSYLLLHQNARATPRSLLEHIPEIIKIIPAAAKQVDLMREKDNSKLIKLSTDLTYGLRRDHPCQER